MFKQILIPTDGSDLSGAAVRAGVDFAKDTGGRVTFVTVTIPFPYSPLGEYAPQTQAIYDDEMRKAGDTALAGAAALARTAGVPCDTRRYHEWSPYLAIVRAADEVGADVIFMASHGRRGMAGMLLGSETQKVLTHCKLPVIVYR